MSQTTQEEKLESEKKLMLCHRCGTMSKGERGHAIHLTKSAGDDLHPPDIDMEKGEYTEIPADEDYQPLVDQSELAELHSEVTDDIHEFELYNPETKGKSDEDEHLEELVEQAIIPTDQNKVQQVASLIDQVSELYSKPEIVKDAVNCSTTTYYEGRNLYDEMEQDSSEDDVEQREGDEQVDAVEEIVWEEGKSLVINGERYVPMEQYKYLVKEINQASQKLKEAGDKGIQIVQKE